MLRGLAILRRLQARRVQALLLAPQRLQGWAESEGIPVACPPDDHPSPGALKLWVSDTLLREAPDRLLVDVFPRGILADLEDSLARSPSAPWLITRRVEPAFYLTPEVRDVVERVYERVVWCEEPPESLRELRLPQLTCAPVCVRDSKECLSRTDAREALGLADSIRVVIALGTGEIERQRDLLRLLEKIQAGTRRTFALVFVSDALPRHQDGELSVRALYPAMGFLRAADLVVAAGGYAAFHETRALGIPAVYLPQRRRYDDQHWRARHSPTANSPSALASAIRATLSRERAPSPGPYPASGADELADELADQLADQLADTIAGPSTSPGVSSAGLLPGDLR